MAIKQFNIIFAPHPRSRRFRNLTFRQSGRLLVLGYAGKVHSGHRWYCACDCGALCVRWSGAIVSGTTVSCGCWRRERIAARNLTHGEAGRDTRTPEYAAYTHARQRCNDSEASQYPNYGGRGIEFHFHSYPEFLTEVGRKPTDQHSLERKNVNGHYEPGNVEWATPTRQRRNRQDTIWLEYEGTRQSLPDLCEQVGKPYYLVYQRLHRGWCVACALSLPARSKCPHH